VTGSKIILNNNDVTPRSPETPQVVESTSDSNEIGLLEIFRIFMRRKWLIISTAIIAVVLTLLYTLHLPRIYTAMARIDIGLNQAQSIKLSDSAQEAAVTTQKLDSQLGILKSRSIAWDVIKRLRLYSDPVFMERPMPAGQDPDKITNGTRVSLTSLFLNSLDVQFERGTELAQIQFRSTSPELAAKVANEIADSYIDRNFQTKYQTTLKATNWLNGQLNGLRNQIVESDKKFADFQEKTGLLQSDETHNPNLDKLLQLNVALGNAQAERILKEELYRSSTSGVEPDQLMPAPTFPALQSLRTQKATLDGEYASLSAKYGDAYPRVTQVKNQISQIETAISREVGRARHQIEVEYQTAASNERSLSAAAEQQKRAIFALNQSALQYTILQRQVVSSRALYEDLVRKLQEAGITSGLNADAISVVDEALPPTIPSAPRKTLNVEVGFAIGLLLGIGIALLLETLNSAIETAEDIKTYANLPTLSFVPHADNIKSLGRLRRGKDDFMRRHAAFRITEDVRSKFAEAFRVLRTNLLLSSAGAPPKVLLVCSSWPNEGKSTTTINLATVLAQADKKVLLVDADLRRPSLQRYFDSPRGGVGLSEILSGERYDQRDFIMPDPLVPHLQLLTAGKIPPSSSELLMSPQMTKVLDDWKDKFDFIVIDSAPILAVSDALFLASIADAVLIVVRAGSTPKKALRTLRDNIIKVRGKIAGVLLNDVKTSSQAYYQYYGGKGGKHDYYYSSSTEDKS
jgi:capsular exopolysaccharide synthesis family protein